MSVIHDVYGELKGDAEIDEWIAENHFETSALRDACVPAGEIIAGDAPDEPPERTAAAMFAMGIIAGVELRKRQEKEETKDFLATS